jgi:hypothetical protein
LSYLIDFQQSNSLHAIRGGAVDTDAIHEHFGICLMELRLPKPTADLLFSPIKPPIFCRRIFGLSEPLANPLDAFGVT